MKVQLSYEHLDAATDNLPVVVDGETWLRESELSITHDKGGKTYTYVYQRPSDGKYFLFRAFLTMYGYEDYSLDMPYQCYEAVEVQPVMVHTSGWEEIKD